MASCRAWSDASAMEQDRQAHRDAQDRVSPAQHRSDFLWGKVVQQVSAQHQHDAKRAQGTSRRALTSPTAVLAEAPTLRYVRRSQCAQCEQPRKCSQSVQAHAPDFCRVRELPCTRTDAVVDRQPRGSREREQRARAVQPVALPADEAMDVRMGRWMNAALHADSVLPGAGLEPGEDRIVNVAMNGHDLRECVSPHALGCRHADMNLQEG